MRLYVHVDVTQSYNATTVYLLISTPVLESIYALSYIFNLGQCDLRQLGPY